MGVFFSIFVVFPPLYPYNIKAGQPINLNKRIKLLDSPCSPSLPEGRLNINVPNKKVSDSSYLLSVWVEMINNRHRELSGAISRDGKNSHLFPRWLFRSWPCPIRARVCFYMERTLTCLAFTRLCRCWYGIRLLLGCEVCRRGLNWDGATGIRGWGGTGSRCCCWLDWFGWWWGWDGWDGCGSCGGGCGCKGGCKGPCTFENMAGMRSHLLPDC